MVHPCFLRASYIGVGIITDRFPSWSLYTYTFILRGCAHGRAAHAEARGEQFLSMLRPLNSLKISKR